MQRRPLLLLAALLSALALSTPSSSAPVLEHRIYLCLAPCPPPPPPPPPTTQCNDGNDNDGDGTTDGGDAGCMDPSDDDECDYKESSGHAQTGAYTYPYQTDTQLVLFWSANGQACDGGLVLGTVYPNCEEGSARWSVSACVRDDPAGGAGLKGTYQCVSAECSSASSPHEMTTRIVPFETWGGSAFTCQHIWSSGIPSSARQTNCY